MKAKALNLKSASSKTYIEPNIPKSKKKYFIPEFPGKYSVNSSRPIIPNYLKPKNLESQTLVTPETIIKGVKNQKF